MEVILLRHAETAGNLEKKYIGSTDEPLCREGKMHALRSGVMPYVPLVYCSTAIRAVQTATIRFPHARVILTPGLREMDFGIFEGRSANEMVNDLRYRAWVDGDCYGECPRGEGRIGFTRRTAIAFSEVIGENLWRGHRYVVIVAHGGTIMSIMERFARPKRDYYDWHVSPCAGYSVQLDEETWERAPVLTNPEKIEA
jgi:alpha-ribazole phosphatase